MAGNPIAVCLAAFAPSDTGSGGPLGVYGNGESVAAAGYEVHYAAVADAPENPASNNVRFLGTDLAAATASLGVMLEQLSPSVVWIHHTSVWEVFAPWRERYAHVLYSSDPEWAVEQLRYQVRTRPSAPHRRVVEILRHRRRVAELRRQERTFFAQASEGGIVAAWGHGDVPGMRRRTGVDVRWCPLAFPDWGLRTEDATGRPAALLLGHLSSTQTRHGIRFFLDEVWPAWSGPGSPASVVRLVGGGSLPASIPLPPRHEKLEVVGFAPSLEDEWNRATAMLVPVPIEVGFRTRIVEAWSKGVPVISHPSAEAGLPMLRAGENYLAARSGEEWAQAMRSLEDDPTLAKEIARRARATYEAELSISAGGARFGDLSRSAASMRSLDG